MSPFGDHRAQKTAIGGEDGGKFESSACDNRDPSNPHFFVTEDAPRGALRRFIPDAAAMKKAEESNDYWYVDSMVVDIRIVSGYISYPFRCFFVFVLQDRPSISR